MRCGLDQLYSWHLIWLLYRGRKNGIFLVCIKSLVCRVGYLVPRVLLAKTSDCVAGKGGLIFGQFLNFKATTWRTTLELVATAANLNCEFWGC